MEKTKKYKSGLSRRNFLKLSALEAASAFVSGCFGAKPQNKNNYWQTYEYQDIYIAAQTQQEIDDTKNTIDYLNEMPDKLKKRFGIEYNEPKRVLDAFRASENPIIKVDKNLTENTGNGASHSTVFYKNSPRKNYITIDTNNISEEHYPELAQKTYHELRHGDQDNHNLLQPTGYSCNDAARIELEAERMANASHAEFKALSTILTIDSQTKEYLPLEKLAKIARIKVMTDICKRATASAIAAAIKEKTHKELPTNEYTEIVKSYGFPDSSYSLSATLAALDEIIEKGPDAVKNLDTKKVAYETLCGDGEDAESFIQTYKDNVSDDDYEKHIFPDASKTPDQPLDDIINKLHNLDDRGTMYPEGATNNPVHLANNDMFDKHVRKPDQNATASLAPEPPKWIVLQSR
ncbi:MAG: hypothetical protein GY804_04780 [Alphaproteobacteria bacterium]|nr:hypothetical protein [Alphaproteobacteria bacterium]